MPVPRRSFKGSFSVCLPLFLVCFDIIWFWLFLLLLLGLCCLFFLLWWWCFFVFWFFLPLTCKLAKKQAKRWFNKCLPSHIFDPVWYSHICIAELKLSFESFLISLFYLSLHQLKTDGMSLLSVFKYPKLMNMKQTFLSIILLKMLILKFNDSS